MSDSNGYMQIVILVVFGLLTGRDANGLDPEDRDVVRLIRL